MTGQKCSALSRVYVERGVADTLLEKLLEATRAIRVGDPCLKENWMGPVISESVADKYDRYCARLREDGGRILLGGARLTEGELAHGHFVAPTVAEAPTTIQARTGTGHEPRVAANYACRCSFRKS